MVGKDVDVLIVGAGPAGLTAANVLSRAGVRFRILDVTDGPTTESRANIVHGRTLEMLYMLGLVDQALDRAVKVRGLNVFQRGKFHAFVPFDGPEAVPTRFPYSLGLKQGEMQDILYQDLKARGGEVEWRTTFVSLSRSASGVDVLINRPDGQQETVHAAYVIAADGGRSAVRQAVGIHLDGSTYEQTAFLADVKLAKNYEAERNTLNQTDGGFVGILPYKGDREYRLFGALSKKFGEKFQAMEQGRKVPVSELNLWFKDVFFLDNEVVSVSWTTIFRIHRRIAPTFQSGRVFLVGDAGHIHAPAGGQGMNLGVGDSFNLAWKLIEVVSGRAKPLLLDSYDTERHGIAEKIINGADKGFELEATQKWYLEIVRMYILPAIIKYGIKTPFLRKTFINLFSQMWIAYRQSQAAGQAFAGYRGQPKPGDRLPFAPCFAAGIGNTDTHELTAGLRYKVFVMPSGEPGQLETKVSALLARYNIDADLITLPNVPTNRALRNLLPGVGVFLVRPDGHLSSMATETDLCTLEQYLTVFHVKT